MFLPLSSSSFIVFCPKGSCFRLSNVSLWPTCLALHVPALLLCDLYFKKPPLYPPLLSQLSAWCLAHWFRCCPCLHFATLVVFRCHLFNWCILFVFYLPVIVMCVHASIKLPLYTPPLFHRKQVVSPLGVCVFQLHILRFPTFCKPSFSKVSCLPFSLLFVCAAHLMLLVPHQHQSQAF
jgi:hypothetical protein